MKSKSYSITSKQFQAIGQALQMSADSPWSGTLPEFNGVILEYAYNGTLLTLMIEKKPMLVPSGHVWEFIDQWMRGFQS